MKTMPTLLALLAGALLVGLPGCGGGSSAPAPGDGTTYPLPGEDLPDLPPVPPPDDLPPPAGDDGATEPPADEPEPPDASPPPPVPPPEPPPKIVPLATLPVWPGFDDVYAVDADPWLGDVYALGALTGELVVLRAGAAQPTPIGVTIVREAYGLAWHGLLGRLFAVVRDPAGCRLVTIDPVELTAASVGLVPGHVALHALAWHPADGLLYAVDSETRSLLALDWLTADVLREVPLEGEFGRISGLASDVAAGALYGVDADDGALLRIDPATGRTVRKAAFGAGPVEGLAHARDTDWFHVVVPAPGKGDAGEGYLAAWDPKGVRVDGREILALAHDPLRGVLYGVHVPSTSLLRIDTVDLWKDVIGETGVVLLEGLAFDATTDRLYGVASRDGMLWRLSTVDATAQPIGLVRGGGGPWSGLSGLAFGRGVLFAVDRPSGDVLEVDPATGSALRLGTVHSEAGIESLAYDGSMPKPGWLHAVANETKMRLGLAVDDPTVPRLVEPADAHVGGLALDRWTGELWATNLDTGAIFVLWRPKEAPQPDVGALVRTPLGTLGFEGTLATLLLVDPPTGALVPLREMPGLDLEALAWDHVAGLVYGADPATGTLYEIAPGTWFVRRVGPEGALGGDVRALAWCAADGALYGVDLLTDELVIVDPATGTAAPVVAGVPLGYGTVEALTWDRATNVLVAVDRSTGTLLEIDRVTALAYPVGSVNADVRALAEGLVPHTLLVWDAATGRVRTIDRVTGAVLDPGD